VANGETRVARQPSAGQSRPSRYLRPALAGLLLLAAIAGIGAASPGIGTGGPLRGHPLAIGIALELLLAALVLALTFLARRSPEPGDLRRQLRYLLRWSTLALMITIAVVLFINYVAIRHRSNLLKLFRPRAKPVPRQTQPARPRELHGPHLTYLVYALIAVLLVVAIAAFVDELADEEDGASLQRAVESGRAALQAVGEARAAIIACYLAMEGSLATAGTARAAAETPDELLARATASGLLHGPAAARLTALFYEARFSTHPLSGSAKTDATTALDEISSELRATARTDLTMSDRGPATAGPVGGAPR
jgi:hypothetical protein